MTARAASHVLLIEPVDFRYNPETGDSNPFQQHVSAAEADRLSHEARRQHRQLRDLLIENGIQVTVARSRRETPDAAFCNNWFSTHPPLNGRPATLVLYPLLAPNRRIERRGDLVDLLRHGYDRVIDFSDREAAGAFLESTGSLCLDDAAQVAYAALSPRTDRALAEEWARALGYRLVTFRATDAAGVPYYHTNVMLFIGHGLAGVGLESIVDPGERGIVERSLRDSGLLVLPITRDQILRYCGNCLPLATDLGERVVVMSSTAYEAFSPAERAVIARHGRILHSPLDAFETLGGGSARCLLGELF
jgi:hypothetical protein